MQNQTLNKLLELTNLYPSPHNGQPIRLKQLDENSFEIYFDRQRGLQATDISYIFSFVSIGVFIEHMSLCAKALGHGFQYDLDLPKENELRGSGLVKVAVCKLAWSKGQPDPPMINAITSRQTSRKKYYEGVSKDVANEITHLAKLRGMRLNRLHSSETKQAIWLNQRAVFDDMFEEPVRQELDHWLRYNQKQKQHMKDGLAYDCMELNGWLIKRIVNHPKILRAPVVSGLIKRYYLRTMADKSSVFYMLAPFASEKNAFDVGEVVMKVWRVIAENDFYLHPFGTIMSNHDAHQDFLRLAGVSEESRQSSYLVFIFRGGKSKPPIRSMRIPYKEHLMLENQNV